MKKHKMTGCARLFIALLIIAPIAYLAAAYYNGQDGLQNIKDLIGIGKESDRQSKSNDVYENTAADLQKTIDDQKKTIEELEKANKQLRDDNALLRKEIDGLKSSQTSDPGQ